MRQLLVATLVGALALPGCTDTSTELDRCEPAGRVVATFQLDGAVDLADAWMVESLDTNLESWYFISAPVSGSVETDAIATWQFPGFSGDVHPVNTPRLSLPANDTAAGLFIGTDPALLANMEPETYGHASWSEIEGYALSQSCVQRLTPALDGAALIEALRSATSEGGMPLVTLAEQLGPESALWGSVELGIRACMAREGFYQWDLPARPYPLVDRDRHGITDETLAAEVGYLPEVSDAELASDSIYSRSEDEQRAFFGDGERVAITRSDGGEVLVPIGGCVQEGSDATLGDFVAWTDLYDQVGRLLDESARLRDRDPRALAALQAWVDCMRLAGYETLSPISDPPVEGGTAAAVADARCNVATGLAEEWTRVEAEIQWELLPSHVDALATLLARTTIDLGG